MESLLTEEEVYSRLTRITSQNGYNFWFDRWIALTCLKEFPVFIFLGVATESLLTEEEV
jgi:hypothetical protein